MSQPFTIGHFVDWSRRLVLDSGGLWEPEGFQSDFAEDLFGGAAECWLVVPEGNGKSTFVAALALYGLRFSEDALIPVAASSRDQARILYRQAKGFLRRSELDDDGAWFEAFDGYRRIDLRGPGSTKRGEVLGSIEVHAADAGTGDGVIPFPYAVVDEAHRHKSLDLYRTWTGKLPKRGAQIIVISTAGDPGGEFEAAREAIREATPVLDSQPGFTRYRSPRIALHEHRLEVGGDVADMEAVKRANPLRTITVDGLAMKWSSPTMTAEHWSRFVCNLPTRDGHAAIAEADWLRQACDLRAPVGEPVDVGLDVGWKWDTTAMVTLWERDSEFRLLGPATVLVPPRDGTMLDGSRVKVELEQIHALNPIRRVVMDMTNAEDIAQWLDQELGVDVVDRSQSPTSKAEEYKAFTAGLRAQTLWHTGDRALTQHVLNAVVNILPRGDGRFARISKSRHGDNDRRVIDALDAAAMVLAVAAAGESEVFVSAW